MRYWSILCSRVKCEEFQRCMYHIRKQSFSVIGSCLPVHCWRCDPLPTEILTEDVGSQQSLLNAAPPSAVLACRPPAPVGRGPPPAACSAAQQLSSSAAQQRLCRLSPSSPVCPSQLLQHQSQFALQVRRRSAVACSAVLRRTASVSLCLSVICEPPRGGEKEKGKRIR